MLAVQNNTRIVLHNILITTDFSPASKASLPYAAAVARKFGAKVFLAHVISPEPHLAVPLEAMPVELDRVWQEAEQNLADFAGQQQLGDAPVETLLERGNFSIVIADLIRTRKIDLVIAGSRGRQGLSRFVLGSSAEKIYRRATCPVLTIGPNIRPFEGGEWEPKRILFPTDGSETSLKALPYALSFAEENLATLTLLQLMPPIFPDFLEAEETRIRESLRALVPIEAQAWCKPEFVVRGGFPADGILKFAEENDVDLIVMGLRKSSEAAIPDHLPWPVASQVVAEVRCPVLTVRG